jgi:hypothetical protein
MGDAAACPPCKKQKPSVTHLPWCDGFFRCTLCPDALGTDGRGYTRARNVPCKNPDIHLVPQGRIYSSFTAGFFHWDTPEARSLDAGTDHMVKAGGTGWCFDCDSVLGHDGQYTQLYKDGRYPNRPVSHTDSFLRIHARTAKDPPQRVLDGLEVRRVKGGDTKIQVMWCDGLYRCLDCVPAGQTRPITRAQCEHFDDLPRIKTTSRHVLHFVPQSNSGLVHDSMGEHFVEINRGAEHGCFACRGDTPTVDTDL